MVKLQDKIITTCARLRRKQKILYITRLVPFYPTLPPRPTRYTFPPTPRFYYATLPPGICDPPMDATDTVP